MCLYCWDCVCVFQWPCVCRCVCVLSSCKLACRINKRADCRSTDEADGLHSSPVFPGGTVPITLWLIIHHSCFLLGRVLMGSDPFTAKSVRTSPSTVYASHLSVSLLFYFSFCRTLRSYQSFSSRTTRWTCQRRTCLWRAGTGGRPSSQVNKPA